MKGPLTMSHSQQVPVMEYILPGDGYIIHQCAIRAAQIGDRNPCPVGTESGVAPRYSGVSHLNIIVQFPSHVHHPGQGILPVNLSPNNHLQECLGGRVRKLSGRASLSDWLSFQVVTAIPTESSRDNNFHPTFRTTHK